MGGKLALWEVFAGVVVRPRSTLRDLHNDEKAALKGLWMLLLVIGAYTVILGIFILRHYPAANPSVLPLPVSQQYRVQIFYQGPCF